MMLDQQHARLPAPTLLRHNSASRLRQQEISAGAGSSPSPPRSPDRASPGSVSAPQHVTLRRASSVGQRIGAGGTMRGASEGSSPPAPSPLASASDEQRPALLPNACVSLHPLACCVWLCIALCLNSHCNCLRANDVCTVAARW